MKPTDDSFPRALTKNERDITLWMIEHGTGNINNYKDHLTKATVVNSCECCGLSICFKIEDKSPTSNTELEILGDYFYGTPDGLCGAFVFARDGQLAGVEFYPLATDEVPTTIPAPHSLRPASFNKSHREQADAGKQLRASA
ncbi:MAG: hypothetical protein ABJQ29_16675 [Luteolibacter sp.]